jgi:hypothetical protein
MSGIVRIRLPHTAVDQHPFIPGLHKENIPAEGQRHREGAKRGKHSFGIVGKHVLDVDFPKRLDNIRK